MLALGMLGVTGLMFAGLGTSNAYAQDNIAASSATNEDNDVVVQSNDADIDQKSKVKCESEAEAESENDRSVQVGDNTNTAVSANDCDTSQ